MPIVVPCDFLPNQKVQPRSDVVSFTGPDGAVVAPIQGGNWETDKEKGALSMTLTFPESMARRDVTIEAGTTMTLKGKVFAKSEIDNLNQEFYKARDKVWKIGGELNDISPTKRSSQRSGMKKPNNGRYDTRTNSVLSQVSKRISLLGAQAFSAAKIQPTPQP